MNPAGGEAETLACRFLKKNGYEIIERNLRTSFGELDIVAKKDGHFHFVEVKSGKQEIAFHPSVHLDRRKQEKLTKLALWYLESQEDEAYGHIDLITVEFYPSSPPKIEHFQDVVGYLS